ncbi:hypothetical protein [Mesobacillus maritimus]|uniref:hypothetical protein n=1 Tax=Mesobacillus maritimus TaxID=1643336 RepID=UPI00384D34C9
MERDRLTQDRLQGSEKGKNEKVKEPNNNELFIPNVNFIYNNPFLTEIDTSAEGDVTTQDNVNEKEREGKPYNQMVLL